jgi:hypothetical protein
MQARISGNRAAQTHESPVTLTGVVIGEPLMYVPTFRFSSQ